MKKTFFILFLTLIFSSSFAKHSFSLGEMVKIYKGYNGNYCLWIEKSNEFKQLIILDASGKFIRKIEIKEDIRPLENENFLHYFAAVRCFPIKDPRWPQKKRIVFIDLTTDDIVQANKPVQEKMEADWISGTNCIYVGGRTYLLNKGKIKIEQQSRIPTSEMSRDGSWVFNPVSSKYGDDKTRVRIEFFNLKGGTMVDVEQFSYSSKIPMDIGEFSLDSKIAYFMNGMAPAIMELKKKKIINFDMVGYTNPQYFGYFLDGDRYAIVWDFYYFEVFDKKKRKVKFNFPNDYTPSFVQILDIKKYEITGVLYKMDKFTGNRDIEKIFSYNWKKKKSLMKPLPRGVKYVEMDGRQAKYFIKKGKSLVLETIELKGEK